MSRRLFSVLLPALLLGCASPYAEHGLTGGYRDTKIDDTHYQVRFDGNGYSSEERVWNFWLYRCAELTKEKGFTYFSIEPARPAAPQSSRRTEEDPGLVRASYAPPGGGGGTHYVYVPGGTIRTWHKNTVIAMHKDVIPAGTPVLRAQTVLDDLGPYVKSDGQDKPMDKDALLKHAAYTVSPDFKIVRAFPE